MVKTVLLFIWVWLSVLVVGSFFVGLYCWLAGLRGKRFDRAFLIWFGFITISFLVGGIAELTQP